MQAQSVPLELVYLLLEQPMKDADIQRQHCQHKEVETNPELFVHAILNCHEGNHPRRVG